MILSLKGHKVNDSTDLQMFSRTGKRTSLKYFQFKNNLRKQPKSNLFASMDQNNENKQIFSIAEEM